MRKMALSEGEVPKQRYNILPDLPKPSPPPINPVTSEPVKPEDLMALFPKECIAQELSQERWIGIPEEVRETYMLWRPTFLYRAIGLERALKTPAKSKKYTTSTKVSVHPVVTSPIQPRHKPTTQ